MSIKLDAQDTIVVDYLHKLWNNSLIQTLIDNNIINIVTEQVTDEQVTEQVTDEQVTDEQVTDEQVTEQVTDEQVTENETENENSELDELEVNKITNSFHNKNTFKKNIKENLKKIREIGFRAYKNIGLEKEVNLIVKSVTDNEISQVYNFKVSNDFNRRNIMKDISRCTIFPKYKSGDTTKPENFRYLVNHHNVIKIIDRLWCVDLINSCGTNLPDKNIYKANLVKAFNGSIIETAVENTKSIDSVVLLDISKAFDSLEWDVLEELLHSNLSKKTSPEKSKELVDQYMTIIKNRKLYYNNHLISNSKGIPTGLPSSNLVFTLVLEEILYRWFTQYNYKNYEDFIMSIYVDDIHMKILKKQNANKIVTSLIDFLGLYKLNINISKSRVCPNLEVDLPNKLSSKDFYLGIPFTRDIELYGKLILSDFQKNKLNLSWVQIYDILCKEKSDDITKKIVGYFNYKLNPLLKNDNENSKEVLKKFIFNNYAKIQIQQRKTKNYLIFATGIFVVIVLLAKFY